VDIIRGYETGLADIKVWEEMEKILRISQRSNRESNKRQILRLFEQIKVK